MSEVLFMCSALLVDVAGVVPVESNVVHVLIAVGWCLVCSDSEFPGGLDLEVFGNSCHRRQAGLCSSHTTGFLLRPGVVVLECMGEVGFRNVN